MCVCEFVCVCLSGLELGCLSVSSGPAAGSGCESVVLVGTREGMCATMLQNLVHNLKIGPLKPSVVRCGPALENKYSAAP